jgi:hypothetical protein
VVEGSPDQLGDCPTGTAAQAPAEPLPHSQAHREMPARSRSPRRSRQFRRVFLSPATPGPVRKEEWEALIGGDCWSDRDVALIIGVGFF